MATHDHNNDNSVYFVPHNGWYPVFTALGIFLSLVGVGHWLNLLKAGQPPSHAILYVGATILALVLFFWFTKVIQENHAGIPNAQVKRSFVWGMSWFIFSEVMFFAAFFGALFYARHFSVPWIGGEGAKGITGEYLWPNFSPTWPVVHNPNPAVFADPHESMAAPALSAWVRYLPFWNTVILLSSSFTVHFAHTAVKENRRGALKFWHYRGRWCALPGSAGLRISPRIHGARADAGLGNLWLDVLHPDRVPRFPRNARCVHSVDAVLPGAARTFQTG
jgi:cytochrome c oxidase subunit 3